MSTPHSVDAPATQSEPAPKPLMRGWLHAAMIPLVIAGAVILFVVSDTRAERVSTLVFSITALMLFGTSALYHRGNWGPVGEGILRRLDHSNIALIIAGTYTPLAVLLLPANTAKILLWIVWVGAAAVIILRTVWLKAPRWSYVPAYLALGWVAVAFLPQFWKNGGALIAMLVIIGGLAYSGGAVIYGLKKPNPWPKYFGFHELFHTCTIIGYLCHYMAVLLAVTAHN